MLKLELAGYFLLMLLAGLGAGYLIGQHRWPELAIGVVVFAVLIGGIALQIRKPS